MKKLLIISLFIPLISFGQTGREYFESGMSKSELKDYYGAISDFTKAIELNSNNRYFYSDRGDAKYELKDYYGAISDYTKAIELSPPNVWYDYGNRGDAKDILKDYYGAISDYTKVIELNPNDGIYYTLRANSKRNLGNLNDACADWKKAAALGYKNAAIYVAKECN